MVWKPGQSGNLNGRPRKYREMPEGMARNDYQNILKRDEYRYTAQDQNLEDPVLFQHRLLSDETIPKVARAVIANQIAPFYRPKLGIMELPRYVVTPIEVPEFSTCEEAEAFLLDLSRREAAQELDTESVATVSARVLDWIHSKRQGVELELKRLASQENDPNVKQQIVITGGLPALPGTQVIMPELNGKHFELEANKDPINHATDYASDHSVPQAPPAAAEPAPPATDKPSE